MGRKRRFLRAWSAATTVAAALALGGPALAQDHPLKGVALVIGEDDYAAITKLDNPKRDARAMDDALDALGFTVDRVIDGDRAKLTAAISEFAAEAKGADVALVYYSGHGIEADGRDFLVPIDADLTTPQTAGASLLPLSDVLATLSKTVPVTIALIDACRTNSFPPGSMVQLPGTSTPVAVASTGLDAMRGPSPVAAASVSPDSLGMVIGFSASPGQPALDGDAGGNSPYAAALLKHLGDAGYSFGDVMTMVSEEVYLKTKAQQLPWTNSSLTRVLSFGAPPAPGDPDEDAIKRGRQHLLLSIAAAPAATRATIEKIATSEGVPLDALYGMLKVLGVDTSAGAGNLEQQLEEGAKRLKTFKEQELGSASSDPELKRLGDLATRAEDEGAIDVALKFREQATARAKVLSAERDTLEAGLKSDRIEIGKTFADHAQTAALNFDYQTEAEMFGAAFDEVKRWDDALAVDYKWGEAAAWRDLGDFKVDNDALVRAIATYKAARDLVPKDGQPQTWSAISSDLGWALETLGERQSDGADLTEAVATLQEAIAAAPADAPAEVIAGTRLNLGNAISVLGQRQSDPALLQKAVAIYRQALVDLPRDGGSQAWALLQLNLGLALRVLGDRSAETDLYAQSITALEAAIDAIPRESDPLGWALAQNDYATALFALGERTHDVGVLQRAADANALALEERTEDRVPLDWAMSMANVADVDIQLGNETGDADWLRKGIEAATEAKRQLDPAKVPLIYGKLESNLGDGLVPLGEKTGDKSQYVAAIAALEEAAKYQTEADDAPDWAMAQLNLAGALIDVGSDEASPADLLAAVDAANGTLRHWTRDNQPVLWARAQFNLGYAYSALGGRETTTDSVSKSATAFEAALTVFDKTANRGEWLSAMTKYALVLEVIGERGGDNSYFAKCADAYRQLLSAVTLADDPQQFGLLNFNLGLALENASAGGDVGSLDGAITAFQTALEGYTRDADAPDWADTQYRLGFALHSRAAAQASGGVDDIKAAIAAYGASLEVKTRDADALAWAEIENYLGTAYGLLGTRTNDRAVLQTGRDDVAAAWDVYRSRDSSYDDDFESRLKQFDAALASAN